MRGFHQLVSSLVVVLAIIVRAGASGLAQVSRSSKSWSPLSRSPSIWLRGGAKRGGSKGRARTSLDVDDEDDDDDDGDDDKDDEREKELGDSDSNGDDSRSKSRGRGIGIEENDEDEDDRPRRKSATRKSGKDRKRTRGAKQSKSGKSGKGKRKGRRSRNQLIKWGETYGKASAGLREGLREKLEEIAKQGQTAYKDVYRRAKVLRSSAFEAMLLRATWPGDDPVPQELLDEIIKHSIPAFKYGRSSAEDDPYHMTMHKLWTKMCEKDWRTVVKSLYIVHCISRDCSVDACNRFALAMKDMSKVRNPKSPDHKYFDVALIKEVDDSSAPYESFVAQYGAYVLHRAKTFSNKFEELKEISDQTHEKQAVARLKRAQQCITNGLKCVVEDRDQQNLITGHATRQVCNDLRDCWKHFTAKLAPLAGVDGVAPYGGAKAEEKDIVSLLQFYRDTGKEIKAFLSRSLKSYGPLRVKIPSEIESKFTPPTDFDDKLAARAALLTTSAPPQGGATSSLKGGDGEDGDGEDDESGVGDSKGSDKGTDRPKSKSKGKNNAVDEGDEEDSDGDKEDDGEEDEDEDDDEDDDEEGDDEDEVDEEGDDDEE